MSQSDTTETKHAPKYRGLAKALAITFALSMILGTGPGVLLANRPTSVLGIPVLYAWGIFWYLVQVGVVLVAYFTVWSELDGESQIASEIAQPEVDGDGGLA